MNTSKIEIMAPVGSFESLMAAIQAGAGSVYFGIGKLNMRSKSAQNFSIDDLHTIAGICNQNNIKSYVTINTVVYDDEIAEMQQLVDAVKKANISAVIASDQAVIQYARQQNVEVHISTQTNITNIEAVRFYAQFADVMVTARELSLDQVKNIVETIEKQQIKGPSGSLVRIEVFVHGALCMAISGKCYLSLDMLGASANRGACIQPCRRSYLVRDFENEVEMQVDNDYIMSPKDLCTLPFLNRIVASGVEVLKIEGRGRSAEYVKTVVQVYSKALDAIANNTFTPETIEKLTQRLATVYNRGFWDGYYLGRKTGEWTEKYGSQATKKKVYIGLVTNFFSRLNVAEIKIESHDLNIGDEIIISGPTTGVYESFVEEIRVDLNPVQQAVKGENCSIPVKELVRRGDKVYRLVSRE
ncbi:MAG: U32 family peptidase [Lentimicrobiaceae bacterium]|jgi:putative protease|nr:U32 family peptidase [Lentimicrobiaceae bacterium]